MNYLKKKPAKPSSSTLVSKEMAAQVPLMAGTSYYPACHLKPKVWCQTEICQVGSSVSCSTPGTKCRCTQLVDIPESNDYVEFVFSAVGVGSVGNGSGFGHPVHLHGHSFHVVDIGYGKYSATTGIINIANSDISCLSDDKCSYPGWTNGVDPFKNISITQYTIRKDTIIVPAGGYVRVWIVADNPGYWFLHCHIEPHQMEGMSVIINELPSK